MLAPPASITIIGFGEAGSILGAELARQGCALRSWDILLLSDTYRPRMLARLSAAGVEPAPDLATALRGAALVISAVTATESAGVARDAAAVLAPGQVFLDINSVAPDTKRSSALAIEAAGASYVEAAVMAPVPPQRLRVPMLLGGARAAQLAESLNALGMDVTAVSRDVGVASAIKMCRSVMIKGLEALCVESLRTARHYGAEDAVLASLAASFPSMGWTQAQPDYLVSRIAQHGRRRAAEMREVAQTVAAAGLDPVMATAIAVAQDALVDEMAAAGIGYDATRAFSLRELADARATAAGTPTRR